MSSGSWWRYPRITIALSIIVGLTLAGMFLYMHQGAVTNCQRINKLSLTLITLVESSAARLGQPGTAGYDYYSHHPQELADARAQESETVQELATTPCR